MQNLRQVFGRRLRLFRKNKSWTQSRLAEEADLSLDMVGRLERGQAAPSFESMARISSVLDVAPSRFFSNRSGAEENNVDHDAALDRITGVLSGASVGDLQRVEKVVSVVLEF